MRHRQVTPVVGDYMTTAPHYLGVTQTLGDARAFMHEYRIRHLPIVRQGTVVGIVSARDLDAARGAGSLGIDDIPVERIMAERPLTAGPNEPLATVARAMAKRKVGSAVVCEHGAIVGLFTVTDALDALADLLERREGTGRESVHRRKNRMRPSKKAAE